MRSFGSIICSICFLLPSSITAISYDVSSTSSIEQAAKTIAAGMMSYYSGNELGGTPGLFPYPPYFWWESGSAFGHLVDYHYYTGDAQYNTETIQATCWQAGTNGQFFPSNQSFDMGNDDQAFWTFTAMNAAETGFPPPESDYPSWSTMVDIVFNEQVNRWDNNTCDGGLHWQVIPVNVGYTYKNIAANGAFFQLAARMARYTSNNTYLQWAEQSWNWLEQSCLLDKTSQTSWRVYDGTEIATNCLVPNRQPWTYNYGLLFTGLAYLYNHTNDEKWLPPLYGILNGTLDLFFKDQVITEISCEPSNTCQNMPNWTTFKSFTIRWMATVTQLVPSLADALWPYIEASAQGAAGQCDGDDGSTCGYHWSTTTWDGTSGLGQEMSALAAVGAPMVRLKNLPAPLSLSTGATSKVMPNQTVGGGSIGDQLVLKPITKADRAGAGILTFILIIATLYVGWSLV